MWIGDNPEQNGQRFFDTTDKAIYDVLVGACDAVLLQRYGWPSWEGKKSDLIEVEFSKCRPFAETKCKYR